MNFKGMFLGIAAMVAVVALSTETRMGSLPQSAFADTEVSTNAVFCVDCDRAQFFNVELELYALTDNCVVVAFGTDSDGDGALSLSETKLELGWRCGAWFMRDRRNGAFLRTVRTPGRRTLNWTARLLPDLSTRSLEANDADGLVFSSSPASCRFNPEWDVVRVTARGATAQSAVAVSLATIGMKVSIR